MSEIFAHIPVLFNETIHGLNIKPDGIYADGTAGGGSHSHRIGEKLSSNGHLIAVDRDIDAISVCKQRLDDLVCKVTLLHSEFAKLPLYLKENNLMLDGILVDLGVSSYQLDTAERGFSYMMDAGLDMRMNREDGFSAKDVVNTYLQSDLEKIFRDYGEERFARQIAANIVKARKIKEIKTTFQLVEIIKSAMPAKALHEKQHPAKRVFQAIRIEVNDELKQVETLLNDIMPYMNTGGRIAVITFHSLEDRIAKRSFAKFEKPCTCPPDFPVCVCGKKSIGRVVDVVTPSKYELENNPRARSSRLRIFEKI